MADEDLVAKVTVEGDAESAAKLAAFAAAGAASFEKVNAAAAKAAAGIKASTAGVQGSAQDAGKALGGVGNTQIGQRSAADLKAIGQAASDLVVGLRRGIKDVAAFAFALTKMGAAGAAAVGGILKLASSVATQASGTSSALEKQTASQIAANNSQLAGEQAQIGYRSSQRQLLDQLRTGAIDYRGYAEGVKKLNADYREQQQVARETAAATDEIKAANDRLQQKMADTKAYDALVSKFGGPLTSSLVSLGKEVNGLFDEFKQAFGPAVAGLLDLLDTSLTKNHATIVAWFDDMAKKIDDLVKNHGPAITQAFENIGRIGGKIFSGLLDALPYLLDLFNNKLVPVLDKIGTYLTGINDKGNEAFGTHMPVGATLALTAITYLAGGFKVLNDVIKISAALVPLLKLAFDLLASTPILRVILLVTLALAALAVAIDWKAFGERAQNAAQLIVGAWQDVKTELNRSSEQMKADADAAWTAIKTGAKSMWEQIKADAQTGANGVQSVWTQMKADADTAWGWTKAGSTSMWEQIKADAKTAQIAMQPIWEQIKADANTAWTFIKTNAQSAWSIIKAGATSMWQQIQADGQTFLTVMTPIWEQVKADAKTAWDTIKAGASSMWEQMKADGQSFLAAMTPIWEQLKADAQTAWTTIKAGASSMWDQIKADGQSTASTLAPLFDTIINKLKNMIGLNKEAASSAPKGGSGGGERAMASGGMVRGPGTSTSDSIGAWLSNNEYVIKARSVAKYGKGFMDAVNSGRLSLDGIRRFAAGGLVTPFTQPRLALASSRSSRGRGATDASRIVNLTIGDQRFENMLAPEDVANRMERYAVSRNSSSAGRKPSWVGGSR